ncbi:hypothetical protein WME91_44945 [Sorangium sp. So ce269]
MKVVKFTKEEEVQVGDWLYFNNRSDYKEKHPGGNAPGWNVMCVSKNEGVRRYIGFGLSDGKDGKVHGYWKGFTSEEIVKILKDAYDEDPKISPQLQKADKKEKFDPLFKKKHEQPEIPQIPQRKSSLLSGGSKRAVSAFDDFEMPRRKGPSKEQTIIDQLDIPVASIAKLGKKQDLAKGGVDTNIGIDFDKPIQRLSVDKLMTYLGKFV